MRRLVLGVGIMLIVGASACKKETPQGTSADQPRPSALAVEEPEPGQQSPATPGPQATPGRGDPTAPREEDESEGEPARTPGQAVTEKQPRAAPSPGGASNTVAPGPAAAGPTTAPLNSTSGAEAPPPASGAPAQPTAPPLPDPRLLLTAADVAEVAGGRVEFQRTALPGVEPDRDRQSLYFEPVKGNDFGFAIQVLRGPDPRSARQRYEQLFATYPNSVEIAPVAGSSFFAYWGDVLHVGFLEPHRNLVVVVSCGRKFCDSDALYALAKKVNSRIK